MLAVSADATRVSASAHAVRIAPASKSNAETSGSTFALVFAAASVVVPTIRVTWD